MCGIIPNISDFSVGFLPAFSSPHIKGSAAESLLCLAHHVEKTFFWLLGPITAPSTFVFAVTRGNLQEAFQQ